MKRLCPYLQFLAETSTEVRSVSAESHSLHLRLTNTFWSRALLLPDPASSKKQPTVASVPPYLTKEMCALPHLVPTLLRYLLIILALQTSQLPWA